MVAVTYRTLGPWGSGKGANLQPSEVDSNFYALAQAIVDIQNNPEAPNGIESITVSGTQMTIYLTDGTVMGPFTLPVLTFRWRDEWDPFAYYMVLDVFKITNLGIFLVEVEHGGTGAPFDPDLVTVDGDPYFLQMFGSVDMSLGALGDVEITDLQDNDFIKWVEAPDPANNKWRNVALGDMIYQDANSIDITGGRITGMLPPSTPTDVATKAYVDALPAGMTTPDSTIMSNISGFGATPAIPNPFSAILDHVLGTTVRGTFLYRSGTGWVAFPPGTPGTFLQTLGPGVDPVWVVGASGVTMVMPGTGITTGGTAITSSGTVSLANIADKNFLANTSGASAAPVPTTLSTFLDLAASSTRGAILTRAGSGWVALAPGTAGYYLQTQGSTADAIWSSPSGSGTVTSISAGTGISTGGAPITGAGTVSLAAIANLSLLANISGSSAAPSAATPSLLFDTVFGATQGSILYRSATAWVVLTPGTSGHLLTSGGAAANPTWAAAPAGASIANLLILSNISGSTAAAIGNTLSGILDAILGSSRGMIIYRGASGWAALSPGTSGQVLTTGGAAGDPHWAASAGGGASISVGDTPPASPSPGDAWWDGVSGQLYIRVDDGTSVQWVPASNQPGPTGATGATGPAGPTGATGPAGSANMSGMTAGQIPIAATATTVTSSTASLAASFMPAFTGDVTSPAGSTVNTLATVPVAKGGTNKTSWTAGRVAFAGAGGAALQEDTANLVYDEINHYLGIGLNGPSARLHVAGQAAAGAITSRIGGGPAGADSTTYMCQFLDFGMTTQAGAITRNGTNTVGYGTASDVRLKSDIADSDRGLDALLALKVSDYRIGDTRQQGLLAQQVAQHYPEAVFEGGDDPQMEPWLLDYGRLTPLLVKAIQDLKAEVDGLRAQLAPKEAPP